MSDLGRYGRPVREYEGVGSLRSGNNRTLPCHFSIIQAPRGQIYAGCEMDTPGLFTGLDETIERLEGYLDDGRDIVAEVAMVTNTEMIHVPGEIHQRVTLYCTSLLVESDDAPQGPVIFKFALSNLILVGTRGYVLERGGGAEEHRLELTLAVDGFEVTIRPVDEYKSVVAQIRANRGNDVTCEATISTDSIGSYDTVIQLVNELCLLLTLARGCRVEWLYYDVITSDGKVVRSFHRSAITKSFGTLELVASDPPEDTVDFVQRGYRVLRAKESKWQLRKAILTYTDAKIEGDYLEMRGLKMAVALEHIRGRFLTLRNRVNILSPNTFDRVVGSLVSAIRWLLPALFPTAKGDQLDLMAEHARGLNWYPFSRALSDLCGELGLQVNSRDRRRFLNIRNALVHTADFHPKLGSAWEQYSFMMTFVGRILLAILEYDGYFYDWTRKPGWAGRYSNLRVKLDLHRREESTPNGAAEEQGDNMAGDS